MLWPIVLIQLGHKTCFGNYHWLITLNELESVRKRRAREKERNRENQWNRVKYFIWFKTVWMIYWFDMLIDREMIFEIRKCKQKIDRLAINQALTHRWINFALHIHLGDEHKIPKWNFDLYQRLKISRKQLTRDLRFTLIDTILMWAKIVIKPKNYSIDMRKKKTNGIHVKMLFEETMRIWIISSKIQMSMNIFQIACFAYFD